MKKFIKIQIATLFVLVFSVQIIAQDATERPLPTFNVFDNSNYTIKGMALGDYEIKFTMQNKENSSPYEFTIYNLNLQTFTNSFKSGIGVTGMDSTNKDVTRVVNTLFYYYMAGLQTLNENIDFTKPKAGVLKLDSTADVSVAKSKLLRQEVRRAMKLLKDNKEISNNDIHPWGGVDILQNNNHSTSQRKQWEIKDKRKEVDSARRCYWYQNESEVVYWFTRKETKEKLEEIIGATMDDYEKEKINDLKKCYYINEKELFEVRYDVKQSQRLVSNTNKKIDDWAKELKQRQISFFEALDKQDKYKSENIGLNKLLLDLPKDIKKEYPDTLSLKFLKRDINNKLSERVSDTTRLQESIKNIEITIAKYRKTIDSINHVLDTTSSSVDTTIIKCRKIIDNKSRDIIDMNKKKQDSLRLLTNLNWLKINLDLVSKTEAEFVFFDWKNKKLDFLMQEYNTKLDTIVEVKLQHEAKQNKLSTRHDSLENAYYDRQLSLNNFKIEIGETQIELKGGFIENMKVKAKVMVEPLGDRVDAPKPLNITFENMKPIGFSREADYDVFKNEKTTLYALHPNGKTMFLVKVGDIIEYDYKHAGNRRDYSPKNDLLVMDGRDKDKNQVVLYKEESHKLFELKVYSDFVGLNETAPNGLIQTEFEKEIPILTRRYSAIKAWRSNWGYLGQVIPKLVISKLEDKNKYLSVHYRDSFNGNEYTPDKYVSTLELYQYESYSAGVDVNLIVFDIINAKSTLEFDGGFRFGATPVVDSARIAKDGLVEMTQGFTHYNITTFRIFPRISLTLFPEERFSLKMAFTHNWYFAKTNLFEQVGNAPEYENQPYEDQLFSHHFNTTEMKVAYKMQNTSSGKLFVRYTYNWQQRYWKTGFNQFQVGYSFYLMGRYKK